MCSVLKIDFIESFLKQHFHCIFASIVKIQNIRNAIGQNSVHAVQISMEYETDESQARNTRQSNLH